MAIRCNRHCPAGRVRLHIAYVVIECFNFSSFWVLRFTLLPYTASTDSINHNQNEDEESGVQRFYAERCTPKSGFIVSAGPTQRRNKVSCAPGTSSTPSFNHVISGLGRP